MRIYKLIFKFFIFYLFYLFIFFSSYLFSNEEEENAIENFTEELEDAFFFPCNLSDKNIKIAISKKGSFFIIENDESIKQIPQIEGLNPEDVEIVCENHHISLIFKNPISSIKITHTYSYNKGNLEFINSKAFDENREFIHQLFQYALAGQKDLILQAKLKESPFFFQYINSEIFQEYIQKAILMDSTLQKKKVLESVGILITKLISYYYYNTELDQKKLADVFNWIEYCNLFGLQNYESLIIEYTKFLSEENSIQILEHLINKNPDFPESYLVLGDLFWKKNSIERSIQYYKLFLEKVQQFNYEVAIPEYVLLRVESYQIKE